MANNTVSFDLELAIKDFNRNLNKVENNLKGFHGDFKKNTKKSSQAWNSFVGNISANAFAAAARGLTSLVNNMAQFGKESFLAAVDAQETASKFEAVFSTISEASNQTAKTLQKNYGLGVTQSKELLSATGDLLAGFGFTQESALKLSQEVQELSVDLASFTNFSGGAKGASEAITKALLGETESMKSLGVSIQQTAVEQQVAINNAKGMTFATERQAKAQATLDLIVKQSGNAIGDYANTSRGAANRLRLLNTRIEDLKIAIGDKLIPVMQPVVDLMIDWVEANERLITQNVEMAITALGNAFKWVKANIDVLMPVLQAVAGIFVGNVLGRGILKVKSALSKLGGVLTTMRTAAMALGGPITIAAAAITALGAAIYYASNASKDSATIDKLNQLKVATADLTQLEKDLRAAQEMGSSSKITDAITARIEARRSEIELLMQDAIIKKELSESEITDIDKLTTKKLTDAEKLAKAESLAAKKARALAKQQKAEKDRAEDEENKRKMKQSDFEEALFGKQVSWEKAGGVQRANNLKSTLSTMATLSESGNSTLAAIGKASAISIATIDGIVAVQKALASAPPPYNFALAGIVGAASAINVAKISGVKLEHGGIVPGSSFAGDSVSAQLNSGEMVLNRGQQNTLFQQANGNTSTSTGNNGISMEMLREALSEVNIVMVADNKEIARSASIGVEQGIVIGRS